MTRTALAVCHLAEMICADEVIGNTLTSGLALRGPGTLSGLSLKCAP
jgi:hypothetical protein